jgi:hypothetical protein
MKTQTKILLIRIAGALSVLFTLFHTGFYWMFKWSQDLAVLQPVNRAILLTLNVVVILLLVYSVIMSLGYPRQLIQTQVGKSLLLFFSSFYLVRIVCEFIYFGFRMPSSLMIITICLIPAICFGLPVLFKSK